MNLEHIKGAVDKMWGAYKQAIGNFADDEKLQTEGERLKKAGAVHRAIGDARDAARNSKQKMILRPKWHPGSD